jgi:hypothetical protein
MHVATSLSLTRTPYKLGFPRRFNASRGDAGEKFMTADNGSAVHGVQTLEAIELRRARCWVLAAVGILFVANALHTMADPDLWGHLQFGLAHLNEGQLARVDPYSYTAYGHAWTNHEWLTEYSFAVAYTWCGVEGLMLLRAALLAATIAAVGVLCLRRNLAPTAMLLLAMFGVSVMAQFFRVRPQMYTYALMAWLIVICDGYRPGRRGGLYLVPVMILVWANLHAGFVAGLGVFGVYWLSFLHEAWQSEHRRKELTVLTGVLVASWAATLVNPYGADYWRYVYFAITLPRPAITEWRTVFSHNDVLQMIYLTAAVTPAVLWLYSTRKGFWAETAVFALGVVLAGRHVRHLPFLVLFGSVVLARRLPEVVAIWGPRLRHHWSRLAQRQALRQQGLHLVHSPVREQHVHWPAVGFFLMVLMTAVGGGWKLGQNLVALTREGALVVSAEDYPVAAVEFLRQNKISGNLDSGFNWGEYCIFKLHTQCRVFCDGRYETIYPSDVSRLALATEGEQNWRARVENYPTDIVLAPADDPFTHWVSAREDFVEVHRDTTARVFVRRTSRNTKLLEAWRVNGLKTVGQTSPRQRFPA